MLGGGVKAPTPNLLHSVKVHNTTQHALHAACHYDNHKERTSITEVAELAPNVTHTFGSKTLDMGGWQAVAPVAHVTVGTSADANTHTAKLQPAVHGIVKELQVHIKGSPEALTLHA